MEHLKALIAAAEPVLRPSQAVVIDNLAPHKGARVRGLIEGAGCRLLFLPPYSPDLNPIEPTWTKLKALATLVDAITQADAAGFFRHCGYAVQ